MGFWDIAKAVGSAAYQGMEKKADNLRQYKEKYERYSDDELLRKVKSTSGDQRIAILRILKERGYTASDIQ